MTQSANPAPSVVDPTHPVDYSKVETPPNYKCHKCGATGCKLWRDYQMFLENQSLLCATCAGAEQNKDVSSMDAEGRRLSDSDNGRTDQIGWRIPAVPTEENDIYWGYGTVPETGCIWWRNLPTLPQTNAT